ncbi:Ectoine hydroxylase-related dioxygenase, phytanoyl-CoA dioxygenase (PhyH) family [Nannocystis exedens]|uniref:Ectoine hydroxylase-related dioxygenase, phytanoyl-CoA dioxygenase (PhyH) family n=1 Tax=Nannocystis exedens TaxID=54 RepID=A0A1I2I0Z2_9BACT|nr:phytanoyl-CoA dioxygenase family protein [Nannocystis exedens]PCC68480.1 phytanoyl-CoA dioxygenase [Nannocystis exedens]SFF36075.1 Ectoine hydroxylase-related dioxygenase, phytanoyl-CoA dioxygenase (PhyH) family [Nannocystis exedens]
MTALAPPPDTHARPDAHAQVRAAYERDGFAVLRGVVDPDTIAEASAHLEWLTARYPELSPEHLHHPLMRDDAFWTSLVTDPRLVDIAEGFLGPDIACFTAHYICKPARTGMAVLWHQDGAYWQLDPMEALTVWLAIDETTAENGCLRMLPGSHRTPLQPIELRSDVPNMLCSSLDARGIDPARAVDITLRPGDVSIHHPQLIHGSEPNRSPTRRCGLDIGYIRTSTRVSNRELYLNPVLVRGRPVPGVNRYRSWPEYVEGSTIPFRAREAWNARARSMNESQQFSGETAEDVLVQTRRMIERLREGTVRT